jgi:UDP-N-acetylglucosamine--N-acetylmuramyl-(pentapeptide) pyrophosphoryl-undecaprenol N-acetylglucosamine transferase
MEMERVPAAGYEIVGLPVCGFDRKRLWRNFKVLLKLWKSMRLANKVLKDFKPEMAIGVGGYASGPMLKAAQKRGIPTLLQEQNSYPGVTNKLLAKNAKEICVAYEGLDKFFPAEKITLTGNPVRSDLVNPDLTQEQAKLALGFDGSKPLILVVGGSLGARTVNKSIANTLNLIANSGASMLWQTGKLYVDEYQPMTNGLKGIKAQAFISRMDLAYRAADIVVSRAGAGTISELQIIGKPVILVPSPNVAEDHQRKNALALVNQKAAIMVLDADAPAQLGKEIIDLLDNDQLRATLSKNIAKMALRNADEKIVELIYKHL